MKSKILLLVLLLMWSSLYAQTPQGFSYQAVVRNSAGQLISHQPIGLRISILSGSPTGTVVYTERQSPMTNAYGLVSVVVGGEPGFENLDWRNGTFYIRSEIDLAGGTNYTLETTQRIFSVPFALNATVADSLAGGAIRTESDPIFTSWDKDYNDLINTPVNISTWINDVGYITDYTETQVLTISHDTVSLTGGSFVKLPAGFSGDYNDLTNKPTNISAFENDAGYITDYTEVQVLSMGHDTIYLTGGSYVVLPLVSESQSLSNVVGFGNSAGGYQLKDVMDPTDPQDAVTLHYLDSVMALLGVDSTSLGSHNVYTVDACDSYDWNGIHCTVGGTYVYPYTNLGGYYSVDTLHLSLRHGTFNVDFQSAQGSYTWHDQLYTSSGVYTYNYQNLNGCPSVDTLKLTINAAGGSHCTAYRFESDTAEVTSCGEYRWYGSVITRSGVYQHSLGTIGHLGCDSVVKISLEVLLDYRTDTAVRAQSPITWRGQLYIQQGDYSDTLMAENGCDSIFSLHLMFGGAHGIGGAPGRYSVSPSNQVLFAHGNLLYQSAIKKWKISEHQYDVLNVNCVGEYYRPWADKFSWATSGYHDVQDSLNFYCKPWDLHQTPASLGSFRYQNNMYGYGPSHFMADTNLTGTSLNYDWGMYNPIINGGNGAGMWRTLSKDEWDYLFNSRNNAAHLRSLGTVNGVAGYIILADNWTNPGGISFVPNAATTSTNNYSLTQWQVLEQSGAVFLPAGFYWSSTSGGSGGAFCLNTAFATPMVAIYNRSNQYRVRLVQDVQLGTRECSCTYYDTVIVSSSTYSWHGHTYSESGDYMEAVVNNAGCDSIISFSLLISDQGQLDSAFSVGAGKKVYFSCGNLQYQTTHDIWRFAMYQYDYLGSDNRYISPTNEKWQDLFSWATSGYHNSTDNLNTAYLPYSTSGNFGPSTNMGEQSLVTESRDYDWGVYLPVANGGNQPDQWRTLTSDEWNYLYNLRPRASQLRRWVNVMGVKGLLLLPDNWSAPVGFFFNTEDEYGGTDWDLLESSGAVFLPAGGYYSSSSAYYIGEACCYWSTTAVPYSTNAHGFYYSPSINTYQNGSGTYSYSRSGRRSVRLVKDM
ncbi:MAG: hypothetical protein MJZ51_06345 [Bacteroidales bacterium]|nr:hypothetical protein [Bacteroidales bacterium]